MTTKYVHPLSALVGALTFALASSPERSLKPVEVEILSHLSIVGVDDGMGGKAKTIRITGANLQIVNGLGATNGNPDFPTQIDPELTAVNGVGNLIVGYNELPPNLGLGRTGTHNVVIGSEHQYTSSGGLVAGRENNIRGVASSVTGGSRNTAGGNFSSISGGSLNHTSGAHASVGGGTSNIAFGSFSSISGGRANGANGSFSSVSGGSYGLADGQSDWVAGSLWEDN